MPVGRCNKGHLHRPREEYEECLTTINENNKLTFSTCHMHPFYFKNWVSPETSGKLMLSTISFECPGTTGSYNYAYSIPEPIIRPGWSFNVPKLGESSFRISSMENKIQELETKYQIISPLLGNSFLDRQYGETNDSLVSKLKTRMDELETEISNLKTSQSQIKESNTNCNCNADSITLQQFNDRIEQLQKEFSSFVEKPLDKGIEKLDEKFSELGNKIENFANLVEQQGRKISTSDFQDFVEKSEIVPFEERIHQLEIKIAKCYRRNLNQQRESKKTVDQSTIDSKNNESEDSDQSWWFIKPQ